MGRDSSPRPLTAQPEGAGQSRGLAASKRLCLGIKAALNAAQVTPGRQCLHSLGWMPKLKGQLDNFVEENCISRC